MPARAIGPALRPLGCTATAAAARPGRVTRATPRPGGLPLLGFEFGGTIDDEDGEVEIHASGQPGPVREPPRGRAGTESRLAMTTTFGGVFDPSRRNGSRLQPRGWFTVLPSGSVIRCRVSPTGRARGVRRSQHHLQGHVSTGLTITF